MKKLNLILAFIGFCIIGLIFVFIAALIFSTRVKNSSINQEFMSSIGPNDRSQTQWNFIYGSNITVEGNCSKFNIVADNLYVLCREDGSVFISEKDGVFKWG